MLDLRQLKYFVVSADEGSFSKAAEILFTTQSSVSKAVSALEDQMQCNLFIRNARGISLTSRGKKFYAQANELILKAEELEKDSANIASDSVHISCAPMSWFAEKFSDYYEEHKNENTKYYIHTDSTKEIMSRVQSGKDEMGFVFVLPENKENFFYECRKQRLVFKTLKEIDGMLYLAPEHQNANETLLKDKKLKFIHMENDDFFGSGEWILEKSGKHFSKTESAVVTNSDYIMNRMLKRGQLANISAETFYDYKKKSPPGLKLKNPNGKILFGVLTNSLEEPCEAAKSFLDWLSSFLSV